MFKKSCVSLGKKPTGKLCQKKNKKSGKRYVIYLTRLLFKTNPFLSFSFLLLWHRKRNISCYLCNIILLPIFTGTLNIFIYSFRCLGSLHDSVLDWDQALPEKKLEISEKICKKSDLTIIAGSSMQVDCFKYVLWVKLFLMFCIKNLCSSVIWRERVKHARRHFCTRVKK